MPWAEKVFADAYHALQHFDADADIGEASITIADHLTASEQYEILLARSVRVVRLSARQFRLASPNLGRSPNPQALILFEIWMLTK